VKKIIFVTTVILASTHLLAEERKRPEFSEIDANSDGKLSLEEFSTVESRRGTPEEMFDRMDKNDDGFVTEQEYQSRGNGGRRSR